MISVVPHSYSPNRSPDRYRQSDQGLQNDYSADSPWKDVYKRQRQWFAIQLAETETAMKIRTVDHSCVFMNTTAVSQRRSKEDVYKRQVCNSPRPDVTPYCDLSLNGLTIKEAIEKTKQYVKEHNLGSVKVNYRLRDAIFSRQRYWGEPFPVDVYKRQAPGCEL